MQCYVCSELLDGDPAYVQHHLNSCLDRQGSSNGHARNDAEQGSAALPPHSLSVSNEQEHDRLLALALASNDCDTPSSDPSNRNPRASSCPCCHRSWLALGLTDSPSNSDSDSDSAALDGTYQEQRASHVEACLFAREEEEQQGKGGLDWPDEAGGGNGQHGRPEDAGEDEAERRGRQVLNGVGVSKKGGIGGEGGAGDAVHETAVMSTPDLVHLLATSLSASHASPHGRTNEAYLATDLVHHVPTRLKDYGWGCGYKNAQMIFSAFRHLPQLVPLLPKSSASVDAVAPIPPIRWWQETIEAAWRQGFDPEGAAHFKFRLVNSRRWIGTTEIYTALSYVGIRTQIVDFPKTKGASGTNQNLVNFILDYFRQPNFLGTAPPAAEPPTETETATRSAFDLLASSAGTPIHRTGRQPLYLQHQGHSRTIVGIEIGKRSRVDVSGSVGSGEGGRRGSLGSKVKGLTKAGRVARGGPKKSAGAERAEEEREEEVWLLLFDPGKPTPQDFKKTASALAQARFDRRRSKLPASNGEERHESPPLPKKLRPSPPAPSRPTSNGKVNRVTPTPKFGEVLKLFRINMRELKKKDDYQVLFIDPHAPPLTPQEKELRKKVSSIVIGGSV